MVKNKMYRILAMAVVLTALFALTAFADLMGGMGEILGLEAGKSYKAASVTINQEGTGAAYDESAAFVLDKTTNTGLAGLYYVTSDNFATKTLIYVYGNHADRADIGEKVVSTTTTNGLWQSKNQLDEFHPGYYSGLAARSPSASIKVGEVTDWNTNINKNTLIGYIATPQTSTFAKIQEELKAKTVKYALTTKEIIPISLVNSYSYTVGAAATTAFSFKYENLVMKFDAYIMDKNGQIKIYSFYDEPYTLRKGANYNSITADFADKTKWTPNLPSEGYFVAFEVHHFDGVDDESNFSVTESNPVNSRVIMKTGAYSIDKPSKIAPPAPAVTFNENTLTWTAENAKLVRYSVDPAVNGTGEIALDGAKTYTFSPATEAGLWALYTPATDVYAESAKTLVYVRGAYIDRKQLGELAAGVTYGEGNLLVSTSINLSQGRLQRSKAHHTSGGGEKHSPYVYYEAISYSDASAVELSTFKNKAAALASATDADRAEKEKEASAAFDTIVNSINGAYYSYVLTQNEIIPINEVYSYKFGLKVGSTMYSANVAYNNNVMKFVAYVADKNGNLTAHSITEAYDLTRTEKVFTMDFTDKNKWTPALPEDGYFVRFEVHPYEGFDTYTDFTVTSVTTSGNNATPLKIIYRFYCDNSGYVIYEPQKPVAPTPKVRVNGTVISGLEASKTYEIVPFNINGADAGEGNANVETVSGVASVDLAALYTTPVGLYAVKSLESDFYKESAMVLAYVYGNFDERKDLGEKALCEKSECGSAHNYWLCKNAVDEFVPGYFSGKAVRHHMNKGTSVIAIDYISTWDYNLTASDMEGYRDATNKEAKFADFVTKLQAQHFKYAFTDKEIVSISEVNKYSFKVNAVSGGLTYTNLDMAFVAHIADENGVITDYTTIINKPELSSGVSTEHEIDFTDASKWSPRLPGDGYLVGYTFSPFYGFNEYSNFEYSSTAGLRVALYPLAYSINDRPIVDVEGISLILGGEIGAKIVFEYDPEEVKAATLVIEGLAPITATLEDGKGEVIVPFYPRLVNTLSYAGSLVCTKTDDSEGTVAIRNISVKNYIEYMQQNPEDYAEWIDLIDALEVYCNYAENYFSEAAPLADLTLEAEEAAFVADNSNRSLDGAMTGVAFHSTSLVLLDTMTIRHYFTVGDTVNLGSITVNGATSLTEATVEKDATSRYAYVDVASISADKLDEEQIVALTLGEETITIKFSAMDYAELTIGDADGKLANLAKAIAKYAYAASQIK